MKKKNTICFLSLLLCAKISPMEAPEHLDTPTTNDQVQMQTEEQRRTPKRPSLFRHLKQRFYRKKPAAPKSPSAIRTTPLPKSLHAKNPSVFTEEEHINDLLAEFIKKNIHESTTTKAFLAATNEDKINKKFKENDDIKQIVEITWHIEHLIPKTAEFQELYKAFENARYSYIKSIIHDHHDKDTCEKAFYDTLASLLFHYKKAYEAKQNVYFNQRKTALKSARFSTMADTDKKTQTIFDKLDSLFSERERNLSSFSIAYTHNEDIKNQTLTLLETITEEETLNKEILTAIKNSKRSSTAKSNWKKLQTFDAQLEKTKAKVHKLLKKYLAIKTHNRNDLLEANMMYILEMDSSKLYNINKLTLLKTASFLGFHPSGSFEDLLTAIKSQLNSLIPQKSIAEIAKQKQEAKENQRNYMIKSIKDSRQFTHKEILEIQTIQDQKRLTEDLIDLVIKRISKISPEDRTKIINYVETHSPFNEIEKYSKEEYSDEKGSDIVDGIIFNFKIINAVVKILNIKLTPPITTE